MFATTKDDSRTISHHSSFLSIFVNLMNNGSNIISILDCWLALFNHFFLLVIPEAKPNHFCWLTDSVICVPDSMQVIAHFPCDLRALRTAQATLVGVLSHRDSCSDIVVFICRPTICNRRNKETKAAQCSFATHIHTYSMCIYFCPIYACVSLPLKHSHRSRSHTHRAIGL